MKHRVEYLLPGSFFPEDEHRDIERRDADLAVAMAPDRAYCFTFYDAEEVPDLGPDFRVTPVHKNKSGRHYIGGALYTVDDLKLLGGHDILVTNMECNHWEHVIQCRTGNWQPFEAGDVLVDA